MELKEATKILNGLIGRCGNCDEEHCDGCYIDSEDTQAMLTVTQELEKLQIINKKLKCSQNMTKKEFENRYVPIDKIKKRVRELIIADCLKVETCFQHDNKALAQIEVLEELLQGSDADGIKRGNRNIKRKM